eukprot:PLAT401.1.p1 GENE.PLAT401.1~~PLAT401.1.p1  ORF type:complete len:535 (-),score=245.46 PLAT401.1:34-1404(-)
MARYIKVLRNMPEETHAQLFTGLLGDEGILSPHARLRSVVAYQLMKACDVLKGAVSPHAEFVLTGVEPFLAIDSGPVSHPLLQFEDQLFLYELVGLIVSPTVSLPEQSASLLRMSLQPLYAQTEVALDSLDSAPDETGFWLAKLIGAMGTITKKIKEADDEMRDILREVLALVSRAFSALPMHSELRMRSIYYLRRMVNLLGAEFLESYLESLMPALLSVSDTMQAYVLLTFLAHAGQHYQAAFGPALSEVLPSVCEATQAVMPPLEACEPKSHALEMRKLLQMEVISFMQTAITAGLSEAMLSDGESLSFLLALLLDGIEGVESVQVHKKAVATLSIVTTHWLDESNPEELISHTSEYLMTSVLPALLSLPLREHISLEDAQTAYMLADSALLQQAIAGLVPMFAETAAESVFPFLPFEADWDAYMHAVMTLDVASWKKVYRDMCLEWRAFMHDR